MADRQAGERVIVDLGNGKQVIIADGRLQLWANRGCLGVQLTSEQEIEIGWAMCLNGMRRKRQRVPPSNHS